jgi:zinc/manganese transport system substrate-binding protein
VLLPVLGCQPVSSLTTSPAKKSIVVTYSILGSIVKELVGDQAQVTVSIPDGIDPHEWEPSARDIEAINNADLVICNGLGLEAGLEKTLETARTRGVRIFTATDFITVREIDHTHEGISGEEGHAHGAGDPHFWTDPLAVKNVVGALVNELMREFDLNVSAQAAGVIDRLDELNQDVAKLVSIIPEEERKLVTGHESMGYFARRYGFKLVGVIVPSLSTQADISAASFVEVKLAIKENNVRVIFAETGTSPAVAEAIARETGARVVELNTHSLPPDGSYFTYLRELCSVIVEAIKQDIT